MRTFCMVIQNANGDEIADRDVEAESLDAAEKEAERLWEHESHDMPNDAWSFLVYDPEETQG